MLIPPEPSYTPLTLIPPEPSNTPLTLVGVVSPPHGAGKAISGSDFYDRVLYHDAYEWPGYNNKKEPGAGVYGGTGKR